MYVEEQVGQHLLKFLPALCQVCCAGVAQLDNNKNNINNIIIIINDNNDNGNDNAFQLMMS